MRKREFLKKLRIRLKTDGCQEIDDIIEYYDELIEDRIDRTGETEEEVVFSLGTIDEIAVRVNSTNSAKNNLRDDKIYYDEYEYATAVKTDSKNTTNNSNTTHTSNKMNKKDSFAIGVLIAVLTFPVWFGAVFGLGAAIFGITIGGIGICIGGFACIAYGIPLLATSIGNGAFAIGIGIILIALATIIIPLIVKLIKLIIKAIIYVVKWLLGKANEIKERRN